MDYILFSNLVNRGNAVLLSKAVNVPTPRLCFYFDGEKYAVPLSDYIDRIITVPGDTANIFYDYKNSDGSLDRSWCRINGTKYSLPVNNRNSPYQIPAGTYTPSTFRSMLNSYLNSGNAKRINNTVTFTQNNKTWTVNANSGYIRRRDWNSGGATAEQDVITFNQTSQPSDATPGTCIILYSNPTFSTYNNYPITISAGFNFV